MRVILCLIIFNFISCSKLVDTFNNEDDVKPKTTKSKSNTVDNFLFSNALATVSDLTECTSSNQGQIYYISSTEEFRGCNGSSWESINLSKSEYRYSYVMDGSLGWSCDDSDSNRNGIHNMLVPIGMTPGKGKLEYYRTTFIGLNYEEDNYTTLPGNVIIKGYIVINGVRVSSLQVDNTFDINDYVDEEPNINLESGQTIFLEREIDCSSFVGSGGGTASLYIIRFKYN